MSQSLDRPYRNLDSGELEKVRRELEQKSKETRAGIVRPTELGLSDPSKPLTKFCPKCGASHAEPFGDIGISSFTRAYGVQVEIYPCGGVIIHSEQEVIISMSKTSGLGTSGQLGFTKVVLTPNK